MNDRKTLAWLRDLAYKAIECGGALLGHYRTEDGDIPVYLTTDRPKNITETCHELRIQPPNKV